MIPLPVNSPCQATVTSSSVFFASSRQLALLRGVNLNTTSDQAITIPVSPWFVHRVFIRNASKAITTAVGGIYTQPNKGGELLVPVNQSWAIGVPPRILDLDIADFATGNEFGYTTLYVSLTTPEGSAATCDLFIEYDETNPSSVATQITSSTTANGCGCNGSSSTGQRVIITVPSPQAPPLVPTDGTDGQNAYSQVAAQFTTPAVDANVTVTLVSSEWIVPGQILEFEFAGAYEAISKPDSTHVIVKNLGYDNNESPGVIIPVAAQVGPGGLKGANGSTPSVTLDSIAPTTTKGDLIVRSATTNSRLAVGTNNYVLVADSTQPLGIKWALVSLTASVSGLLPVANGGTGIGTLNGMVHGNGTSAMSALLWNFGSAVDPSTANDNTQNYGVGSVWLNTTADKAWICLDASTGAAVWQQITTSATSVQAVAFGGTGVTALPSFRVNKGGTNQTGVVNNTETKVTWSTEDFDTNNNFASDRFTPMIAGKYQLFTLVRFTVTADQTQIAVRIKKNGTITAETIVDGSGTASISIPVLDIQPANGTTDYFEVFVYQSTGSDKIIDGTATYTYFTGAWISP